MPSAATRSPSLKTVDRPEGERPRPPQLSWAPTRPTAAVRPTSELVPPARREAAASPAPAARARADLSRAARGRDDGGKTGGGDLRPARRGRRPAAGRAGEGHAEVPAAAQLRGGRFAFPLVSVGATENALMAATLARGTTVLENAAREPEIADLARCLKAMGARIEGEGSPTITVEGVDRLHGATHRVVADRIELGTYMLAPAVAGGSVECLGGRLDLVGAFAEKLGAAGVEIEETPRGVTVTRTANRVRAVDVATEPFPGFPTDLQAQMMALMCTAEGTSVLEERIFENRFMHAPELTRMGAAIEVHGGTARVTGVERLRGAPVMATDLRASVSLILAGLAAEGETVVRRVYHLDRGYERLEEKLSGVGARVERVPET